MSLDTFSIFYYDFDIDETAKFLSIDEGSGELIAEIQRGSYTPTELAVQIKIALDLVGANTYTVTFDRNTRGFTISSTVNFSLLVSSGTSGASAFGVIGFVGADRASASTYTGASAGDFYEPQFILQDYIEPDDFQKLVDPTINKTATGRVEVVRFGIERFYQMNMKYLTNKPSDGKVIKNNPTGIADLRRFMQFAFLKKPMEFMPNINARSTFDEVILESTDSDSQGTSFKLKELYDKGLPGVFETGVLIFRVVE